MEKGGGGGAVVEGWPTGNSWLEGPAAIVHRAEDKAVQTAKSLWLSPDYSIELAEHTAHRSPAPLLSTLRAQSAKEQTHGFPGWVAGQNSIALIGPHVETNGM